MTSAAILLRRAVGGDAKALNNLDSVSEQTGANLEEDQGELLLTAGAVAAVLRDYVAGRVSPAEAQRWASLMRWGQIPAESGRSARPVDIGYDPLREDAITECIGRLTELGDVVDGELRDGEAEELLRALTD